MIRITFLLRKHPDLSHEAFHRYWLEEHGPLVASHARRLNMLRYVQVHTLDDPANEAMAKSRGGMQAPYDGVAELWFDSLESIRSDDPARQKAAAELLADERNFIDLPNSPMWFAREHLIVGETTERA